MTPRHRLFRSRRAAPTAATFGLLLLGACSAELPTPAGPNTDPDAACLGTRDYFAQKAWPQVFGSKCIACHAPDGIAVEQDAAFKLLPASYPGFIEANLEAVREVARNEYDGISLLLAKPSALAKHGGGKVIEKGDPSYAMLEELIKRLSEGDPCEVSEVDPDFVGVQMLDAGDTYRKATLQLAGRLPNDKELASLKSKGEKALPGLLEALMKEEAFYTRLKEMFNDTFLTDRYYHDSDAVNLLNRDQYPQVEGWFNTVEGDERDAVNRALAREPLELIAHIVRNDKSFTEIVTANYTVVNPYSAQLYGLNLTFKDPTDQNEWVEAKARVLRDGTFVNVPHAGLLTNPMWMNRFPTSETNRNRHRARMVMKQFLATDILKVAERPVDPLLASEYNNPTRDNPACATCHRQLDPIAGAFMKWDDDDQEEYLPERDWHRDMFAPGYGDELMPVDQFAGAQRWLAQRIVKDPRFALSAVHQMYSAITGHQPLDYPKEDVADYDQLLVAWQAQERVFRAIVDEFIAKKYNLRVVVRGIVLSPYFRAKNVDEGFNEGALLSLQDVGTGRLTIPEVLDRKVQAIVGFKWTRGYDRESYLRGDYELLYGGIDSESVISRLTDLNSVMSGVQWRMANEVSCTAGSWDFGRPQSDRKLFKYVEPTTTPTKAGVDDPEAVAAIKKNIQYLHERFWGTHPEIDDPEIDATYELFLQTFREGLQGVAAKEISERLPYNCQCRRDPVSGQDLPQAQIIERDDQYTIRAWMAVLTYLMSDYQFLYE